MRAACASELCRPVRYGVDVSLAASWASLVYSDFVYSDFVCIQRSHPGAEISRGRFAIAAGPGSVTVERIVLRPFRVRVTVVSSGYPVFAIAYSDRAERPDRHRASRYKKLCARVALVWR